MPDTVVTLADSVLTRPKPSRKHWRSGGRWIIDSAIYKGNEPFNLFDL